MACHRLLFALLLVSWRSFAYGQHPALGRRALLSQDSSEAIDQGWQQGTGGWGGMGSGSGNGGSSSSTPQMGGRGWGGRGWSGNGGPSPAWQQPAQPTSLMQPQWGSGSGGSSSQGSGQGSSGGNTPAPQPSRNPFAPQAPPQRGWGSGGMGSLPTAATQPGRAEPNQGFSRSGPSQGSWWNPRGNSLTSMPAASTPRPRPTVPATAAPVPAVSQAPSRGWGGSGWGGNPGWGGGGGGWGSRPSGISSTPIGQPGNPVPTVIPGGGGGGGGGGRGRPGGAESSGRGGLSAGTGGWGSGGGGGMGGRPIVGPDGRWNSNRPRPSLAPLVGDTTQFSRINRRPIQASGVANTLAQGIRRRGNARSAAQSLAQAYSSGQGEAAAQALASAAAEGGDTVAVADAVAETVQAQPRVAPWLLQKSANLAVNSGNTQSFSRAMANAFTAANQRKVMPQFTNAVADAISQGGAPTRYAFGQAIATAVAQGGDSQAAVAEATAQAMCAGGSTASAWASAYAVALSTDARGCLVLNEAKAMARARCGPSGAESFARSQTNSLVLGFCGLMDLIPGLGGINLGGWSGGNAGSSTTGESGFANGNGFGATGNPYSFNSLPDDAGSTGDYNSDYAGLNGGRR